MIVDAIVDGNVQTMCFATIRWIFGSHLVDVAGSGEEWPPVPVNTILVEGKREHSVRRLKRLFDTVAVVNIDINVQNSLMLSQQKLYGNDDVVDVAKARCQILFRVMQPSGPVNGYVRLLVKQVVCCTHRCTGVKRDVVPQSVENWAIVRVTTKPIGDVLGVIRFCVLRRDSGLRKHYSPRVNNS